MYKILCGGISSKPATGEEILQLNVRGQNNNVNLRIQDIQRSMVTPVPPALMDLLEVAAYVYCADQHIKRGGNKLSDMGDGWRRQMHFTIPVRNPDLWNSDAMQSALLDTLGFLSDDSYRFEFVKSNQPFNDLQAYLEFSDDSNGGAFQPDEIGLFSGGLDSFSGVVEDLADHKKKLVLVGHHSSEKVHALQKELVKALREKGFDKQILYISVQVTNDNNERAKETTQRARSFLFSSIAITIAHLFKKQKIKFYENGVVSLNLPISGDVLGARATRTTHPRVLKGFETIFSLLLKQDVVVENPYRWKTKAEITGVAKKHGFERLVGTTNSCTRPHLWTKELTHCGVCSQCIDRRFAIMAAGLGNDDPVSQYRVELLTGMRDKELDILMAADYVKFAREIDGMTIERFQTQYPQIFDAAPYAQELTQQEAIQQIYALLKRHAAEVMGVIGRAAREKAGDMVAGKLPPNCILSMSMAGPGKIDPGNLNGMTSRFDALEKRLTELSSPAHEFFVDEKNKRIMFAGNFYLDATEYSLVKTLLPQFEKGKNSGKDIEPSPAAELARQLFNGSEPNLRQLISRLHKKLKDHLGAQLGIPDAEDFIENVKGQGYRLAAKFKRLTTPEDFSLPEAPAVTDKTA